MIDLPLHMLRATLMMISQLTDEILLWEGGGCVQVFLCSGGGTVGVLHACVQATVIGDPLNHELCSWI